MRLSSKRLKNKEVKRNISMAATRKMNGLSQTMIALGQSNPYHDTIIQKVIFLEKQIKVEAVRKIAKEKFLPNWRFRTSVNIKKSGEIEWVDDGVSPDLDYHVVGIDIPTAGGRQYANQEDVNNFIAGFYGKKMDLSRPPWQLIAITNAKNAGPDGDSDCVLIARLHHVIGDGISLEAFSLTLFDDFDITKPTNGQVNTKPSSKKNKALWPKVPVYAQFFNRLRILLEGTVEGIAAINLPGDTSNALKVSTARDLKGRVAALSKSISLEKVKEIKNLTGCTVNDVLFACLAGLLRSYLIETEGRVAPNMKIHTNCLINMRSNEETQALLGKDAADVALDNKFNFLPIRMPVNSTTPLQRLYACKRELDEKKHSPAPLIAMKLSILAFIMLPRNVVMQCMYQAFDRVTTMLSNVPGPKDEKFICGIKVNSMTFFSPGLVASNFGLISYNNKITLSILSDEKVLPEPQKFAELFPKELDKLYEAVQQTDFEKPRKQEYYIDVLVVLAPFAILFFLRYLF
mmetsp:Transcript_15782/g.18421  ORF Transcript_15782/g.18421 Transcript_15782/m.18421 type:complete len:517 (+) Transcript_15782:55-1605(+)